MAGESATLLAPGYRIDTVRTTSAPLAQTAEVMGCLEPGDSPARPRWTTVQFLGVCSCFIGLHMFWVFPGYIAAKSCASLIPFYAGYLVVLIPVMYVQMRAGAHTRMNIVSLFSNYCPILKGVGIACVLRLFLVTIYFNVFIAYLLNFCMGAMKSPMAWTTCPGNLSTIGECDNTTENFASSAHPSEAVYFERTVLQASVGVSEEGTVPAFLAVGLVSAWMITFALTMAGVRVFAWMMAVLGGVATLMAIALLAYIREETEHIEPETVIYRPDWDSLTGPSPEAAITDTWLSGVLHAVVMSQLWTGVLPTMGKYSGRNKYNSHGRWAILFLFLTIIPHLFIFLVSSLMSALGASTSNAFMDVMLGSTDPLMGNYSLVFVNFPAAFHHLGLKNGVTFVFFFMIFIYAVQAQALWATVAIDNITDFFRRTMLSCGKPCIYLMVSAAYCATGLALGIPLVTEAGIYLVGLVMSWIDKFLFVIAFFSSIAFVITYARLQFNLINKIIFLIWFVLASLMCTAMLLFKSGLLEEPQEFSMQVLYRQYYTYPTWAYILGWLIAAGPIVVGVMFGAMHAIATAPGARCEKCAYACCYNDPDTGTLKNRKKKGHGGEEEDYLHPKH